MGIVLLEPPTVAESEQEVGMNEAQDFVSRRAAENFLVACVVHDETELRKHEREERGVEKFDPWIMECFYQQERGAEQNEVEKHLADVIGTLFRQ